MKYIQIEGESLINLEKVFVFNIYTLLSGSYFSWNAQQFIFSKLTFFFWSFFWSNKLRGLITRLFTRTFTRTFIKIFSLTVCRFKRRNRSRRKASIKSTAFFLSSFINLINSFCPGWKEWIKMEPTSDWRSLSFYFWTLYKT